MAIHLRGQRTMQNQTADKTDRAGPDPEPRCPNCEYIVAGLPQARCPECGKEFTWEQAWASAEALPRIAFEKSAGWSIASGFLQTWLTILFVPWVFARQAAKRINLKSGLFFGGVCFLLCWVSAILPDAAPPNFIVTWTITGAIHVLIQSLLLVGLDWPHWKKWKESLAFWLAIGGYTSAIVPTEIVYGPPLVDFSSLPDLFSNSSGAFIRMPSEPLVHWVQIGAWLIGLACVMFARLRAAKSSGLVAGWIALVAVAVVYHLFVASILFVGMRVGEVMGVK